MKQTIEEKLESLQKQITSIHGTMGGLKQKTVRELYSEPEIARLNERINNLMEYQEEREERERQQDKEAFTSKQSFLLGEIAGKVSLITNGRIEDMPDALDGLNRYLKERIAELYYKDV